MTCGSFGGTVNVQSKAFASESAMHRFQVMYEANGETKRTLVWACSDVSARMKVEAEHPERKVISVMIDTPAEPPPRPVR